MYNFEVCLQMILNEKLPNFQSQCSPHRDRVKKCSHFVAAATLKACTTPQGRAKWFGGQGHCLILSLIFDGVHGFSTTGLVLGRRDQLLAQIGDGLFFQGGLSLIRILQGH